MRATRLPLPMTGQLGYLDSGGARARRADRSRRRSPMRSRASRRSATAVGRRRRSPGPCATPAPWDHRMRASRLCGRCCSSTAAWSTDARGIVSGWRGRSCWYTAPMGVWKSWPTVTAHRRSRLGSGRGGAEAGARDPVTGNVAGRHLSNRSRRRASSPPSEGPRRLWFCPGCSRFCSRLIRSCGGLAPIDAGAPDKLRAAACTGCHPAVHSEWAQSRHGLAWTNAIFQREYKDRPLEWCVHCHAPLTEQLAEVRRGGGAARRRRRQLRGLSHPRAGRVLSRTKSPGSPHDTDARPDFGGTAYCAGCHQFTFPTIEPDPDRKGPGRVTGYTAHPMQDTVAQHARGPHADKECLSCHLRRGCRRTGFPAATTTT